MIFVVGAPRSGTSLTMGLLEACGANLGNVGGLNQIHAVRDKLTAPYLRKAGVDPIAQHPLMDPADWYDVPDWRAQVLDVVGEATAVKVVPAVTFWPLWAKHFPDAKYVFVYRDPQKVAESCARTAFMKAHGEDVYLWRAYADYYHGCCAQMSQHTDMRTVMSQDVLKGDYESLFSVIDWAGLNWDEQAVKAVIRPDRWHG